MDIKKYEDFNNEALDVLKEIGSIGTGNAATALSSVIDKKIKMTMPEVRILEYNKAIEKLGGPELTVVAVLVELSGDMTGMMMYLQSVSAIDQLFETLFGKKLDNPEKLDEISMSALSEVANIIISSYITAIAGLADLKVNLSVPAITVNMLGGVLSVPMIEFGYKTDKLMSIGGEFICDGDHIDSNLILLPEIDSLVHLLNKLGVSS